MPCQGQKSKTAELVQFSSVELPFDKMLSEVVHVGFLEDMSLKPGLKLLAPMLATDGWIAHESSRQLMEQR